MEKTEHDRSLTDKAVRGAQIAKGAAKAAGGIASGNFALSAQGAAETMSPKVIAAIVVIIAVFISLPTIIILTVPQLLFSWGSVNDAELLERRTHAAEIVRTFETVTANEEEGVTPDIYWHTVIECVRSKQDIESISVSDAEEAVRRSYTKDSETGEIHNKSPDTIMNELGFTAEEKNWAYLMHKNPRGTARELLS